jgi:hypothetical protein
MKSLCIPLRIQTVLGLMASDVSLSWEHHNIAHPSEQLGTHGG